MQLNMYQMSWRILRVRAIVGYVTQSVRRTDQDLKAIITEELQYTPSIDATGVSVLVSDGTVTLSGEVASLPEQLAAKRAAMRVGGVKDVTDKMVVQTPAASSSNDQDIADAASQILNCAVDVPANTVKVDVHDHKVALSGHVTWQYQRAAAARAVTNIKGVTRIDNNISLNQPAPAFGTEAKVEAAMLRNDQLDARKISVDLSGHQLTLRGSVQSWGQYRQAEHAAWGAAGVTSVKNDILVIS